MSYRTIGERPDYSVSKEDINREKALDLLNDEGVMISYNNLLASFKTKLFYFVCLVIGFIFSNRVYSWITPDNYSFIQNFDLVIIFHICGTLLVALFIGIIIKSIVGLFNITQHLFANLLFIFRVWNSKRKYGHLIDKE